MTTRPTPDRGSALPLVLVFVTVISLVVMATATYAITTLKYGEAVESRADHLAAAQGAMDDALEQLRLKRSLCATSAGGAPVPFPEPINGADASVTCSIVGGNVPPSDGWALVITGQTSVPGDTLVFTLGGRPNIGGPVYVHDAGRVSYAKETTIVEGDLWHHDPVCAAGTLDELHYQRSNLSITNLWFDPATRGTYCVNRTWDQLFAQQPPVPDLAALPVRGPEPHETRDGCRIFLPGRYAQRPDLGTNNYFSNGVYHFDDLGKMEIKGEAVTMGQITDLEGFPATENTACDAVRANDLPDPADPNDLPGATLYLGGTTSIEMGSNSSFEVSRRKQGNYFVGVHVLDDSNPSGTHIMSADPGAKKELAVQGLLWAPNSSLEFGTVPAQKAAVLRGGAVLARFHGGVTSAAIGMVIEIPTSQASTTLLIESTATDSRGSATVRVVADYRPSSGEVAVNSWRVL